MHGTRQPREDYVKNSQSERAKRRGRARNLVRASGLQRAVYSRMGQQRSTQFRCRCYQSFGIFFLSSSFFLYLLPTVIRSLFHTGGQLSAAETVSNAVDLLSMMRCISSDPAWASMYTRASGMPRASSKYLFFLLPNCIILSLPNLFGSVFFFLSWLPWLVFPRLGAHLLQM